ncbi:hypothetical protein [Kribbella italica]|uniref:Uncharacterized protein n=1 Tax=Kribbella italica TaxID=1540520 RepID=A0A7W9J957_9ACTN|nr:hypothetical protein [Kribbella italica]MBB5837208.1 hypothetical protein [Kribbella italica]
MWLDGVQTTGSKPAPPKDGQDFLLTLRQIGPDGTPSVSAAGTIFGVGNGLVESITGTAQVRLPQGEYAVSSSQIVDQPDGVGQDAYELTQPVVELTKDSTVVLDARTARQVTVRSSARPEARSRLLAVGHDRRSADGANSFSRVVMAEPADRLFTAQQGPAAGPDELTGHAVAYLIAPGTNTPYLYATADRRAGAFYTGCAASSKIGTWGSSRGVSTRRRSGR